MRKEGQTSTDARKHTPGSSVLGAFGGVGVAGSLACSFAMIAAAVGLLGAGGATAARTTTGSMNGMASTRVPARAQGWVGFLIRNGPGLLAVSIVLVVVSLWFRRRSASGLALAGGAILYASMYRQGNLTVMYAGIAVGTAVVLAGFGWGLIRATRVESRDSLLNSTEQLR